MQLNVVEFEASLLCDPEPSVSFVRRLTCADGAVTEVALWSHSFDTVDEAEVFLAWMRRREPRWTYWGRYSSAFGSRDVVATIAEGVAEDAEQRVWAERLAREEADRVERLSMVFGHFPFERAGRFGVGIRQGDDAEPFWTILFDERWERERFLDWFRCQHHRLGELATYLSTRSGLDLERLLLGEMIQTERRIKKAGLAAGGRRPLRFYRGDL